MEHVIRIQREHHNSFHKFDTLVSLKVPSGCPEQFFIAIFFCREVYYQHRNSTVLQREEEARRKVDSALKVRKQSEISKRCEEEEEKKEIII